ncbi:MAG: BREX-2 system adenine-specific DNA-methyltransferase PglX [Fibrobacteres bacterium]|nr:BREX-2 system adenine-specific DNA-methyltransferase PglX [Fibrobacterota bacterium]
MIATPDLTRQCQKLVRDFTPFLRQRLKALPAEDQALRARYRELRQHDQTSETEVDWLDAQLDQAAVAWVLACVFVRFLEDNRWLEHTWIAGVLVDEEGRNRLQWALDRQTQWFQENPSKSDLDYLEHVFKNMALYPGVSDLFGAGHNPLWSLKPTADGATFLLRFWRERDGSTGHLVRDFASDDRADTRFLGDLYQDLSEMARKRFALLQTPDFVEEFILDRTLTPALATFGLMPDGKPFRMIDPTCGSGHFLLGSFKRMVAAWERKEPGLDRIELVNRALSHIHGVDLNPFAVSIARFRLLLAAYHACGRRMLGGPRFELNLAVGDSLLHGPDRGTRQGDLLHENRPWHSDPLVSDESDAAFRLLHQGTYHAVVGNPPYISVKDSSQREAIKSNYETCFMKWTLSVPFTERFFQLAVKAQTGGEAGYVGLINSNNFAKREFGKKMIEEYFPKVELTQVLDTSGCYIPGHGTPTVILCGRNRSPRAELPVRAVLGIRGEPGKPDDAAQGQVWVTLVREVDNPGTETKWLSVVDAERSVFSKHPWSLGGGGASELKEAMEGKWERLDQIALATGITSVNGEDDVFVLPGHSASKRLGLETTIPLVVGDDIREWKLGNTWPAVWLYDPNFELLDLDAVPGIAKYLWATRMFIQNRKRFGRPIIERGMKWYEWQEIYANKLRIPLSITFAFVGTHNHFVLCRGGMVFKQTAPVIKLSANATLDDHLNLLSLLNSSTLEFWLRQVCFNKGDSTDSQGARVTSIPWVNSYEYGSTIVEKAPLATAYFEERLALTRELDALGQELSTLQPSRLFATVTPTAAMLESTSKRVATVRARMIALQEELDWWVYRAYDLMEPTDGERLTRSVNQVPEGLALGERAFELHLARQAQDGEDSSWFERHGSTPITEVPATWSDADKQIVQARLDLIASHPWIGLLERPEHKRRWAGDSWDKQAHEGLRTWLLDRLEAASLWSEPVVLSVYELADRVGRDADFQQVCALYAPGKERGALLTELLATECVPAQRAHCYTESGLRKRAAWEQTWELQRREDAGEKVDVPVPPRYDSKDFLKAHVWSQRGKLDVPRERFVVLPGVNKLDDPSPLVLWAGMDHGKRALALVALLEDLTHRGLTDEAAQSLLVALLELEPWLHQWHGTVEPGADESLAVAITNYLNDKLRERSLTRTQLRDWKPVAAAPVKRGRKKAAETE